MPVNKDARPQWDCKGNIMPIYTISKIIISTIGRERERERERERGGYHLQSNKIYHIQWDIMRSYLENI